MTSTMHIPTVLGDYLFQTKLPFYVSSSSGCENDHAGHPYQEQNQRDTNRHQCQHGSNSKDVNEEHREITLAKCQIAQHPALPYPPSLAASARSLAYAACNASIFASICHWKEPRHLGSWAWRR